MNRFLSQKFRFYSFVCIALLLFVHGYNLRVTYLEPFSLVHEPLTFTTFLEYFLANGLLRFRLPMLFMISGYIFAMQDYKPHGERMGKRFHTLIIPYLIWSALALGMTFLWQQFPTTAQAVYDSQLDQYGDNRPYTEMGWIDLLKRWLLRPVAFQLWFIRSLFVYNLLYPVIRWLLQKAPALWLALLFVMWISFTTLPLLEGQGLFFFSAGIWLYKRNIPIDKKPAWFSYYLSWLLFVGLVMIKTFMAFEMEEHNVWNKAGFSLLHIGSVLAGVLAIWFSGDAVVRWAMKQYWFTWSTAFAFVVYAFHIPLLPYITQIFFRYLHLLPNYRLITYLMAPVLVLFLCILTGALLRQWFPKAYGLATGGRGFRGLG